MANALAVLGLLIWCALFFIGLNLYAASSILYALFSFSFLLLVLSAFYKNNSYAYMFVAIFLWMGFWVKLSAHLIIGYDYVEPIGGFSGFANDWDQVLWVSTVACWGVLVGRFLFMFRSEAERGAIHNTPLFHPGWYPYRRKVLWVFLIVFVLGVALANVLLGVQQIGLAPKTILLWPLNALISWVVSIGSAIAVASLVWWELSFNRKSWVSMLAFLIEAFVSTTSILSRGAYIFHSVPQMIALYKNKKHLTLALSMPRLSALVVVFCLLFVVSIVSVTTFRAYLYPHAGGFTTLDQKRLTRLEVLNGGIYNIRLMISKGEHRDVELLAHLREKVELEKALGLPPSKDHIMFKDLEVLEENISKEKITSLSSSSYQPQNLEKLLEDRKHLIKRIRKLHLTSAHRKRIRIEVLSGGIENLKDMMLKGEDREQELLNLLKEKDRLKMDLRLPLSKEHRILSRIFALDKTIANEKALMAENPAYESQVLQQLLQDRAFLVEKLFTLKPKPVSATERHINKEGVEKEMFTFIPKAFAKELKVKEVPLSSLEVASEVGQSDLLKELLYQFKTGWLKQVLSLSVDRWIGLEGVMAVVAYDEKSPGFILDAVVEKRSVGSITKYQAVCNSKYLYTDNKTWQFASLPGSTAFLYFSGSVWVVFVGMFLFSVSIQLAEKGVFSLTGNPLLCGLLGGVLANWVTQFGITPRQDIPYYSMIILAVLFLAVVQRIKLFRPNELI